MKKELQITLWQYKSIQQKPSALLWELGLSRQTGSPAETALISLLDLNSVCDNCNLALRVKYHFTQAVIHHVKVGSVSWIGHFRQKRGRELMQGRPVQPSEKGMAPEVTEALPPKTVFPLRDEPGD